MKKLVYAFAVIMAVSFASCKTDDGSNSAEQAEETPVENVAGGDSLQEKTGDSTEVKAEEPKAEEVKADAAPAQEEAKPEAASEAKAQEEAAK